MGDGRVEEWAGERAESVAAGGTYARLRPRLIVCSSGRGGPGRIQTVEKRLRYARDDVRALGMRVRLLEEQLRQSAGPEAADGA